MGSERARQADLRMAPWVVILTAAGTRHDSDKRCVCKLIHMSPAAKIRVIFDNLRPEQDSMPLLAAQRLASASASIANRELHAVRQGERSSVAHAGTASPPPTSLESPPHRLRRIRGH